MADKRPNLLILHSHDLGQYLHCYGRKTVRTPNLDGFAAKGVRFSNSFCTQPGCSPSRASIFTGRYPHSNGVMGLSHVQFAWDLKPGERHLAQILRDEGYSTTCVGVMHEASSIERCGYEQRFGNARAKRVADKTIELLKAHDPDRDKPFFISAGSFEPHRQPYSEPQFETGRKTDRCLPGKHLAPKDAGAVEVPEYLMDTPGTRKELAGLETAVEYVDEHFGRILDELEATGLDGNTLVIFTTDHGVAMPRAKCTVYDPGIEVAFILRFAGRDGWDRGVVREELVSNVDYLPTILDRLGIEVPENVHGRSLAPLLDGREYEERDAIFAELTYHGYYDPIRIVRTKTHKLVVNFSTAPGFMDSSQAWRPPSDTVANRGIHPYVELYDLEADPNETTNLLGRGLPGLESDEIPESTRSTARDLLERLHAHMVDTGDPLLEGPIACPHHTAATSLVEGKTEI